MNREQAEDLLRDVTIANDITNTVLDVLSYQGFLKEATAEQEDRLAGAISRALIQRVWWNQR